MSESKDLTRLLNDWVQGDQAAFDQAAPLLYQELHRIATQIFARERGQHTLQATALVHEAYVRLIGMDVELSNRDHFFALAARLMRRLLINHAKARKASKRGGGALCITLREDQLAADAGTDLLVLDAALSRLSEHDPRKAEILELNYFGGLTQPAIGRLLNISESTVRREQRTATLWLRKFMTDLEGA